MKAVLRFVPVVVLTVLTGCVSMFSGFMFSPTAGEINADNKSIAVVAGVDNDINIAVTESMTEALARNSTFKVMPAKQVTKRVTGYPQQIKGPYNSAHITIDIDYSKTDLQKVKEIMKKLGTDYAYVIWAPTGYSRTAISQGTGGVSGSAAVYPAVAQLFQGPDAKVVGQGRFDVTSVKYVPLTSPSEDDVKNAVHYTTEIISKIVAEKSGALKR
ncbi:MAG: hypothetical protein HYS23_09610 [Geobacter sp.]|nr:hypothetical protein [Geobacter sp.]